ncbi:AraC family transcriptional regulator [Robertmurraya korlensis]|uniref:helix-turn-helix domain-containing protein n=1 Tax=Robertmurraya korlensis TaxID=519977 RepID=UPI00203D99A6|nr:AraC family transcriptional regulator [Robertmurraya korlensis]MCM3601008.1 AraC family transcriptional regulator [Robertmurraya korlensis]
MLNVISELIKVPEGMSKEPSNQSIIKMNGLTVIESCLPTKKTEGRMFLEDHMLLFVLKGRYLLKFGNQSYLVKDREMLLIHKSIVVSYEKFGDERADDLLDYMMFFLKDELLNEFIKMTNLQSSFPSTVIPISVYPMNERLTGYIESLKPILKESNRIQEGLVRLKLLELLYDVADTDEKFLYQFLHLRHNERKSISQVVEENIYNPVSIDDLAYLSGRSLSTFKREFKEIYNSPPLKWIRNRRLDKARELLLHTPFSITEICFSTGFENVAHFSRVFKERFGVSPSMYKQSLNRLIN